MSTTHGTAIRSQLWRELKEWGWAPDKPFVSYTQAELQAVYAELAGAPLEARPQTASAAPEDPQEALAPPTFQEFMADLPAAPPDAERAQTAPLAVDAPIPLSDSPDPRELPGMRKGLEPIRQDSQGRIWLQEEFRKPAAPKPRARRVLRYTETGTKTETITGADGYTESFEVAGEGPGRPAEIKITLPTYQVGIYQDPRFPFKVHCYNGQEGFDREDVEEFYGGPELVPATVKRNYVANSLCYDMRSVIRSIQEEYRHLQLTGRLPQ
jgi:hypothetical protein